VYENVGVIGDGDGDVAVCDVAVRQSHDSGGGFFLKPRGGRRPVAPSPERE
jgi:hypothetical protein